ncbi:hypothetical protein SeLEV6574_g07454 [Synchytrium endobioticum]|uniref:Uncharacterized protein n=1 Tax=Synchytrium endobioticum TaxID=286115 RepID=A0A507CL18_9FUNG|nr:hypothetical protein SeLEV6574_g07454 [Synchytrium endobioticum]
MKPNMMKKVIAIVVLQATILYYLVSAGGCFNGGHGQDTADLAARVTTQNQDNRARDRDDAVSSMEAIVHSRSTLVELNRMDENLDAVSRDLAALAERDANLAGASAPGRSTNWLFRGVAENDEEQRLGRAEIYRKAAALQAQHAAHLPGASARANSQD